MTTGAACGVCETDIANSWRVSYNINASWPKIIEIIDTNARKWRYAGPGGFNDMDMLVVGSRMGRQSHTHATRPCVRRGAVRVHTEEQ